MLWFVSLALAADPPREVAAFARAHAQRPSWSADGTLIAVEANDHEARRVTLHVGPANGPLSVVKPAPRSQSGMTSGFSSRPAEHPVVHELCWAPAGLGNAYVFVAADRGQDYDLYLAGAGPILAAPGADGGPAWSSDGRWIAFTSARTGEGDLYLAEASQLDAPPRRLTTLANASELYPTWSTDGAQLAWVAHSPTGDNLFLLSSLDTRPVKMTDWSGTQVRPRFSPGPPRIAFYANHEDPARFDLYVVDAREGAAPKRVLAGVVPDSAGPSWTPDGTALIAVLDDDDALDPVVRVPADGGPHQVLDLGTVGNGDLAVGVRDGKTWVAWVAQGRVGDPVRDFKRLFAAPLP